MPASGTKQNEGARLRAKGSRGIIDLGAGKWKIDIESFADRIDVAADLGPIDASPDREQLAEKPACCVRGHVSSQFRFYQAELRCGTLRQQCGERRERSTRSSRTWTSPPAGRDHAEPPVQASGDHTHGQRTDTPNHHTKTQHTTTIPDPSTSPDLSRSPSSGTTTTRTHCGGSPRT